MKSHKQTLISPLSNTMAEVERQGIPEFSFDNTKALDSKDMDNQLIMEGPPESNMSAMDKNVRNCFLRSPKA